MPSVEATLDAPWINFASSAQQARKSFVNREFTNQLSGRVLRKPFALTSILAGWGVERVSPSLVTRAIDGREVENCEQMPLRAGSPSPGRAPARRYAAPL